MRTRAAMSLLLNMDKKQSMITARYHNAAIESPDSTCLFNPVSGIFQGSNGDWGFCMTV
jgi:hypothetical protein